jgi:prepilin-type N-terminal cleavage/methylation domain-containing protein
MKSKELFMLKKLMALSRAELKSKLDSIDVSAVKGRSLKRKFEAIRSKKQGGFTLLELLVVVAILAAIAGTATIMLQDTDRKGMAAAHVAMMDELAKGIATYRVLNGGAYPDVWDSLLAGTSSVSPAPVASFVSIVNDDLTTSLGITQLTTSGLAALNNVGIRRVRVVNPEAKPVPGSAYDCSTTTIDGDYSIRNLVADKGNDVTPQNIFMSADTEKGCGYATHYPLDVDDNVAYWNSSPERIGLPGDFTKTDIVAFGVGPDSTLFNASNIGALSNVPVYRHNASGEYNRFIVLWNLNPKVQVYNEDTENYDYKSVGGSQAAFQAIVDAAGDTKDEELGEVDNVRSTI